MKQLKRKLIDMYSDYVNNFFINIQRFADHYNISKEQAERVINIGRALKDHNINKLHKLRQAKIDELFKTIKF
jgi:hypothetical protein